jgi:hypothetical protein
VIAQAQKIVPKKGFKIIKKPTVTINKNSKNVRVSNFCMEVILNEARGWHRADYTGAGGECHPSARNALYSAG